MKELSIEEKVKRYESALEKCRKLYKEAKANEYISDIEDYETIFPELKESDDEKIKGAIIHFISHTPSVPKGVIGKETMLDWLEKQGQKKCIDDLTQQEAMDIAVAKCFEQGEQKTAWTEADDEELEIALNALKGAGEYDSAAWLLTLKQRIGE